MVALLHPIHLLIVGKDTVAAPTSAIPMANTYAFQGAGADAHGWSCHPHGGAAVRWRVLVTCAVFYPLLVLGVMSPFALALYVAWLCVIWLVSGLRRGSKARGKVE